MLNKRTNNFTIEILHRNTNSLGMRNALQLIVNHTYPIAFEIPRRAASHRGYCRSSIVG